ncbi:hypothetical protein [Plasmodium yoelii yoelii]|uniref:Uncharacterized protein n=1 Tax=Plasmodium yoelii yoelii TaxID=73239 RepID=Q7RQW0_PLAYO|nr:hypothetical protein [Plasmodium yoelii yoelii]
MLNAVLLFHINGYTIRFSETFLITTQHYFTIEVIKYRIFNKLFE